MQWASGTYCWVGGSVCVRVNQIKVQEAHYLTDGNIFLHLFEIQHLILWNKTLALSQ